MTQRDDYLDGVTICRKAKSIEIPYPENSAKRVAAYCRVSTDLEIQESSLTLQMESYNRIIEEHSQWKLAGIYADKGLSGTRAINRPEFNRMIADARSGKIDVILAKSLSRFARNTVDTLQYTRELKQIGVTVYFEKEKIDTASASSEFLLTIFAAFAQEESHSISENTKRGIRNRFALGQPRYAKILGYNKDWSPNEDAWIVKKIFELAFDGKSKREIASILNEEGVVTAGGLHTWSHNTIYGILRNEKYPGDVLMQKTFTGDYMQHNKVYNRGLIIDSYYRENHHTAIVDKNMFLALKFETNLKRGKNGADQTPYFGLLKCPSCGKSMVKIPGIYAEKRPMWVCPGENTSEILDERRTCDKQILLSETIDSAIRQALDDIGNQPGFDADILKLKELMKKSGKPSYCRLVSLVKSMTMEHDNILAVDWKMGWTGRYEIHPVKDAEKQWPALAKAHVIDVEADGTRLYKVNHPYRRRKS